MSEATDDTELRGPEQPDPQTPSLGLPQALARDALKSMLFGRPPAPRRIGRYRIIEVLGEGGMGLVFHAHDDELSRPVALKVLHESEGEGSVGRARLVREAQAMAQLSHPNVVQVHDVGEHDGQVFIAMELVRGQTLRSWVEELGDGSARSRRWKEVVAMFVQAARGLAAAHEVGLIHRDFKPANALVGRDGRLRVLDFGLARARASGVIGGEDETAGGLPRDDELVDPEGDTRRPAPSPSESASSMPPTLEETMTVAGTLLGTPAYAAPEQLEGRRADAASDQFSFCVSLFEALHGVRPFGGTTLHELIEHMSEGRRAELPAGVAVPGWLATAIDRGLAFSPSERWPSMDALIEALLDDPAVRRRRRRIALGSLGLVAALGAGAWVHEQREQARCEAEGAAVLEDWSDEARTTAREAFAGTELAMAESTWDRVAPRLDAWTGQWSEAREAACLTARDGREEDRLRERCLDRQRWQLASTVDVLGDADGDVVLNAVAMVSDLPHAGACEEPGGLAAVEAAADADASRPELERIRRDLVQVIVDERAGRTAEALTGAEGARDEAEALGDDALRAEARFHLGTVLNTRGDFDQAEAELRQAYFLAGGIGYDPLAADAAVGLMDTVGNRLARPREGHDWAAHARMAMQRMGQSPEAAKAEYFENLGNIRYAEGRYAEAGAEYERAVARHEQLRGGEHPAVASMLNNLGIVQRLLGEPDEAERLYLRGLALTERTLGADHPEAAMLLTNLGTLDDRRGRHEAAQGRYRRALAIQEAALGAESSKVVSTLGLLGESLRAEGRLDEALAAHERALAAAQASLGTDHPQTARAHTNLGATLEALGRLDEAFAQQRLSLELRERTLGPDHPELVGSLSKLGFALEARGRYADALVLYQRAAAILEREQGPDHPELASRLDDLGVGLRLVGRLDEALAAHRRALAIRQAHLEPDDPSFAASQDCIGEVLVAQGRAAEAVAAHERALAIREATVGARHARTAKTLRLLGLAQLEAGVTIDARERLGRSLEILEELAGSDDARLVPTLLGLGRVELAEERPEEAVTILERALALLGDEHVDPHLRNDVESVLARARGYEGRASTARTEHP